MPNSVSSGTNVERADRAAIPDLPPLGYGSGYGEGARAARGSTSAVRFAQKAAIRRPLAERIRSTQSAMVNLNSAFRFAVVEC
jgi:hypothetical protein